MSDNRKYYYLKLKENYFDDDSIAVSYTHLDVYKRQVSILSVLQKYAPLFGSFATQEEKPF